MHAPTSQPLQLKGQLLLKSVVTFLIHMQGDHSPGYIELPNFSSPLLTISGIMCTSILQFIKQWHASNMRLKTSLINNLVYWFTST